MFRHNPLRYGTLALLFAGAVYAAFAAGYFGLEILIEILVLAMLVLAIDMVAGFGGMVSLCHGALLGVGAYAYSMLAVKVGVADPVAMVLAIGITGFQVNAMGFEQRHCHAACIPAGSTDCQGFAFEIRNGFDVAFNAGNILGSTGRDRKQRAHVFIFFDQIFRVFIEFTTALNGIFVMGGADGDDVGGDLATVVVRIPAGHFRGDTLADKLVPVTLVSGVDRIAVDLGPRVQGLLKPLAGLAVLGPGRRCGRFDPCPCFGRCFLVNPVEIFDDVGQNT